MGSRTFTLFELLSRGNGKVSRVHAESGVPVTLDTVAEEDGTITGIVVVTTDNERGASHARRPSRTPPSPEERDSLTGSGDDCGGSVSCYEDNPYIPPPPPSERIGNPFSFNYVRPASRKSDASRPYLGPDPILATLLNLYVTIKTLEDPTFTLETAYLDIFSDIVVGELGSLINKVTSPPGGYSSLFLPPPVSLSHLVTANLPSSLRNAPIQYVYDSWWEGFNSGESPTSYPSSNPYVIWAAGAGANLYFSSPGFIGPPPWLFVVNKYNSFLFRIDRNTFDIDRYFKVIGPKMFGAYGGYAQRLMLYVADDEPDPLLGFRPKHSSGKDQLFEFDFESGSFLRGWQFPAATLFDVFYIQDGSPRAITCVAYTESGNPRRLFTVIDLNTGDILGYFVFDVNAFLQDAFGSGISDGRYSIFVRPMGVLDAFIVLGVSITPCNGESANRIYVIRAGGSYSDDIFPVVEGFHVLYNVQMPSFYYSMFPTSFMRDDTGFYADIFCYATLDTIPGG